MNFFTGLFLLILPLGGYPSDNDVNEPDVPDGNPDCDSRERLYADNQQLFLLYRDKGSLYAFEGYFYIDILGVRNYYTVKNESGPFQDPDGPLKILNQIKTSIPDFKQFWCVDDASGIRIFYEITETNVEVPLPQVKP